MFGWINQFLPLPKSEQGVVRTQHHALGGKFLDAEALIGVKQADHIRVDHLQPQRKRRFAQSHRKGIENQIQILLFSRRFVPRIRFRGDNGNN